MCYDAILLWVRAKTSFILYIYICSGVRFTGDNAIAGYDFSRSRRSGRRKVSVDRESSGDLVTTSEKGRRGLRTRLSVRRALSVDRRPTRQRAAGSIAIECAPLLETYVRTEAISEVQTLSIGEGSNWVCLPTSHRRKFQMKDGVIA